MTQLEKQESMFTHLKQLEEAGASTPTSITLPDDTPYDRWEALVVFTSRTRHATQWWLGDLLNFGDRVYGEKYSQAVEVTGFKAQTLMNYCAVASAIPPERRIEGLSAYIHRAVVRLDPDQQTEWLERAYAEGWDYDRLSAEINGVIPAEKPKRKKQEALPVEATNDEQAEVEENVEAETYSGEYPATATFWYVKLGPFENDAAALGVAAEIIRVNGAAFGVLVEEE